MQRRLSSVLLAICPLLLPVKCCPQTVQQQQRDRVASRTGTAQALPATASSIESLQTIADVVVDQNLEAFDDGSGPYWSAGPAYAGGVWAEDFTYTLLMNPGKFVGLHGAAAINNVAAHFVAAADAHGQLPPEVLASGLPGRTYSGFDANQRYVSGVSSDMVALMCWESWRKSGSTACYKASVAAVKRAQAYWPRDPVTHLPTVVLGANEWEPASLFLELPRFSGDVGSAAVLLAASDAAMYQQAVAANDGINATFFLTEFDQVSTSIAARLLDPATSMVLGATGNNRQIDNLSSGMAVWFSSLVGMDIVPSRVQIVIGNYFYAHRHDQTYNGYWLNSASAWKVQGIIPAGGSPSGRYTYGCSANSAGTGPGKVTPDPLPYQNGYWSLVTGMAAQAMYLAGHADGIPTLLASFRDAPQGRSGDPAWEYYTGNGGHRSGDFCRNATTPNMESPQSASWAARNLVGAMPIVGVPMLNKYGALVTPSTRHRRTQ